MPSPSEETTNSSSGVPILPEGTLLGDRYRIDGADRRGRHGPVYLPTHADIDKQVAVKVLHPSYSRMPDWSLRFRREAQAPRARIGHPGIVEVFDSGTTDDGSVYFVME